MPHHGSSHDEQSIFSFIEATQTSSHFCIKKKRTIWLAPTTPLLSMGIPKSSNVKAFTKFFSYFLDIFQGSYKDKTPKMILWFTCIDQVCRTNSLFGFGTLNPRAGSAFPPHHLQFRHVLLPQLFVLNRHLKLTGLIHWPPGKQPRKSASWPLNTTPQLTARDLSRPSGERFALRRH